MSIDESRRELTPGVDVPEVDLRARGVSRVTSTRTVRGACTVCSARFARTGGGWSHTAATGHVVEFTYSTRFAYVRGPVGGEGR